MGASVNDPLSISGHGGQIDAMARAFPDAPKPWIDLSTGINPLAYPIGPIPSEAWHRLPTASDRESCETAMARAFGCDPAYCRAVAGTELAIRQLPELLGPRRVALRGRSYTDHAESWAAAGADILAVNEPLSVVESANAVVLVNPNNPDGVRWSREQIDYARESLAKRDGWLIIDEAYADLDPARSMAPMAGLDGLVVLRSFGKFFGLAGVRLGAVLAQPHILAGLGHKLGGWDVSGPALAIGASAYADLDWQNAMRFRLREASSALSHLLSKASVEDVGGTDLFRFVRVPDAAVMWEKLAQQGISVRRFSGDNRHLRIGLPKLEEFGRLAHALSFSTA